MRDLLRVRHVACPPILNHSVAGNGRDVHWRPRAGAVTLSCDVIAVDCRIQRDEIAALERIRTQLEVDPATARAIERAAEVRFQAA